MKNEFDPYLTWLGIPRSQQPPDYYQLVGIDRFEKNPDAIKAAVVKRVAYLQDVSSGPHVKQAQKILNEIAAANVCLTDRHKKAEYDNRLRKSISKKSKPTANSTSPLSHSKAATPTVKAPGKSKPVEFAAQKAATSISGTENNREPDASPNRASKSNHAIWILIGVGSLAAVVLGAVLIFKTMGRGSGNAYSKNTEVVQRDSETPIEPGKRKQIKSFDQYPLPPAFPPAEIADESVAKEGLVLWLDADDSETIRFNYSNHVRWWLDKSGNQNHAGKADTGRQPKLEQDRLAGKPTVVFPGKRFLTVEHESQFDFGTQFTIFYVAAQAKAGGVFLSKGIATEPNCFSIYKNLSALRITKSTKQLYRADKEPEQPAIFALIVFDGSLQWFINGKPDSRVQTISTDNFKINNDYPLMIGNRSKSASYFHGELAELLIYNRALAPNQRSSIENYLAEKWLQ